MDYSEILFLGIKRNLLFPTKGSIVFGLKKNGSGVSLGYAVTYPSN